MVNNKKNNLLYTVLVIIGLLLLLIPFFIFDIGNSINGTDHLTRFGFHVLAFTLALLAGSAFSAGMSSAAGSTVTLKATAWTAAAIVGTAVTYNTVKQVSSDVKLNEASLPIDTISLSVNTFAPDSLAGMSTLSQSDSTIDMVSSETDLKKEQEINLPDTKENTSVYSENNKTTSKEKNAGTDTKKIITNKTITETKNANLSNNSTLSETCNSFQIIHGSKYLDRNLGLSVYDPNKTLKFNNDCGCILKNATMTLSRGNNLLEQKNQTGNFINLHTFKDLQADDKLALDIKQATCKDSKGISFLYTFPKPILTVILISDHREFETASEIKNNKKNPKELPDNSTIKSTPKDKVEEESNKFGN